MGPLSQERLDFWHDAGVRLVIVQAVDPPAGYPPGQTHQQLDAVLNDGRFAADAYVYLWHDAIWLTDRNAHLLDGYEGMLRRVWLDVEDAEGANYWTQNVEDVRAGIDICERYSWSGIYTGRWYWTKYTMNTEDAAASSLPLWDAHYDGIPDVAGFVPYGGWSRRFIKQHIGRWQAGVDLNVLHPAEEQNVNQWMGRGDMPEEDSSDAEAPAVPCADEINLLGYLQGDLANAFEAVVDNLEADMLDRVVELRSLIASLRQ